MGRLGSALFCYNQGCIHLSQEVDEQKEYIYGKCLIL